MDAIETGLLVVSFVVLMLSKSFSAYEEDFVRYDWTQVNKRARGETQSSRGYTWSACPRVCVFEWEVRGFTCAPPAIEETGMGARPRTSSLDKYGNCNQHM